LQLLPAGLAIQLNVAALPGMCYTVWAGRNCEGAGRELNPKALGVWFGPHVHCFPRVANYRLAQVLFMGIGPSLALSANSRGTVLPLNHVDCNCLFLFEFIMILFAKYIKKKMLKKVKNKV
jgi:hypothetical protein